MADQIRTGQVIDALLAKCRALPGFADPNVCGNSDEQVLVCDGPELFTLEDADCGGYLVIGWSGTPDAAVPAATTDWTSGPIAGNARPRDETTTVQCLASVDSADSAKLARDQALLIVSAAAGVCRDDPSLGIATSGVIGGHKVTAFVTAGTFTQSVSEDGFSASQEFTVTYQARV